MQLNPLIYFPPLRVWGFRGSDLGVQILTYNLHIAQERGSPPAGGRGQAAQGSQRMLAVKSANHLLVYSVPRRVTRLRNQ